jgi:chemotaxis protein CheC
MNEDRNPVNITAEFLKVAKTGLENSAKAVRTLLSDTIVMSVVWAGSMPTSHFGDVSGNPEDLVIGAYVRVTGNIPGHALLVFSRDDAMVLSDIALGFPMGTTTELGEMEESVVQEVANVLTSSYLTAIADYYHFPLLPDPPLMAVDMAGAIVQNVLLSSGQLDQETLSIVTKFKIRNRSLNGFFLYIPETMPAAESEAA